MGRREPGGCRALWFGVRVPNKVADLSIAAHSVCLNTLFSGSIVHTTHER